MLLQKDSVQLVASQKYFTNLIFCPIIIKGNIRLSKMGQRVHFSVSCMSTKSLSKAIFAATMKSCLTAIIFVMLVCRVGANFPCKPEQIHWNTTVGKRPKCSDCPDCPPGTEPSVPCGTSVHDRPDIHCVSCKLGKTFSDKYDTSQCKACTICSEGKAVKNSCNLTENTKCENECGPGFYTVRLIFGCSPCAQCCGDGKDVFAAECANKKKQCKVRHTPCTRVKTTPSKPTKRNYSTSKPTKRNYSTSKPTKRNYSTSKPTKRNYSTANTSPTVHTTGDTTTVTLYQEEKSTSRELNVSITPTSALDNEVLQIQNVESGQRDGIMSAVVILLIVAAALCAVFIVVIVKGIIPVRDMLRSSREQNLNNEGRNISQGRTLPLPHSSARSSQDSATPLLNLSESHQHIVSTPLQTSGTLSSQPNETESSEPSYSSASTHSSNSVSLHANEHDSPQPNRSRSVLSQPSESVSSQPDGSASTHSNQSEAAARQSTRSAQEQVKSNSGDLTLEELEEKHFPVFERMCKDLNSTTSGPWWDFERLASCYEKISLSDRNSLKNEFQSDRGNPSNVLMTHIKTKYPDHSVRDLVRKLQRIGRDDIAQRLNRTLSENHHPRKGTNTGGEL